MGSVIVYALRFDDGAIYVGMTKDWARRLEEHRQRKSPSVRRRKGNFEVIYTKSFENYQQGRVHEVYLKSGAGRKKLAVGED